MDQNRKKQHNFIKYGALGVWCILAIVVFVNRSKITVDSIINFTPSNLVLAAVVLLLLFALKSLSIVFFSGILYTASGIMFSLPVAMFVNALGVVVMLSEGYLLGKYFGSDLVGNVAQKYPKINNILHLEDKRPFLFTLLLRMMKLLNFDLGSIYMGASNAKFIPYAAASFISAIPDLILYAVVGGGISSLSPSMIVAAAIIYGCITVASILIIAYLVKHPEKIGG